MPISNEMAATLTCSAPGTLGVVLLGVLVALFSSCDQRPQVKIEGGTLPVFKLTGRGNIQVITINGPDFENPNSREAGSRYMKPFWQIVPQDDYDLTRLGQSGGLV